MRHNKFALLNLLAFLSFAVVTTEFAMVGFLPEIAVQLDISLAKAGKFVTWFALGAAVVGPCLTLLAKAFDAKRVLVLVVIAFTLANVVIVTLPHYQVIVVTRFIQGGFLPVILSIIAMIAVDTFGDNRQYWAISRVNVGVVIATVIGIPLSAFLALKYNWQLIFLLLSVLGFFAIIGVVIYLPHVTPEKQKTKKNKSPLILQPLFLLHLLISMFLFTALFTVYTYITPFILAITTFNNEAVGWLLFIFGVAGVVGNWVAGQLFFQRIIQPSVYLSLLFFLVVMLFTHIGAYWKFSALFILALWGAVHMAAFVITQVRIIQVAHEDKAFALSLNMAVCNLGIGCGAVVGGWVSSQYAVDKVGNVAASIALVTALVAWLCQIQRK